MMSQYAEQLEKINKSLESQLADLQVSLQSNIDSAEERGMRLIEAETQLRVADELAKAVKDYLKEWDLLGENGECAELTEGSVGMILIKGLASYEKARGVK